VQEIVTNEGPVYHFDRPGVSMELAAVTQPQLHRVEWEIDVRIRDKDLTVIRVNPPAARMNLQQDTVRFIPYGSGQAMPISARRESYVANPYPSMLDLQYLAAWNSEAGRGLYCGFHDILGSHKVELSECHDGALRMETMIHAIGIDESRNGFHLTGNVTWQLFDGDWYDAALIYKNWVHTCAYWFTGVPSKDRDDVPEWMLKVPAWFLVSLNGENWLDNLLEARADLKDMPVAAHVYNWHQIPFDTNYPHYKPEVPGFKEKVALMQANDIRVMPYINGRLWDMQDRGDEDYQFTKVAKPAATKDRTGRVWSESYGSKNAKGELRKLAVMCPSTAVWQEKMIEINKWLLQDLGVDAVYLDQISAAQNINCMDPSHAHRKGGGSWWYDYYYHMMDHLKLLCNKEQGFTSECTAETYVGHIGGMLSWKWDMEYGVPAYSVIYAGYQPLFGRLFGTLEDTDTFRILVAQSLCFGDQMGWMDPKLYLNNPYRKFYFDLVHLRWQYNEYFYAGSCLRPPKLEGDLGMLSGYQITTEGMLSAMWEKWQDNSRIVIVVNMTDERRKVKVSPEGADAFEVEMAPVSAIVRPI